MYMVERPNEFSLQKIGKCITKYPEELGVIGFSSKSVLTVACKKGDLEVVELIVKAGVDLEWKDYSNFTALAKAVNRGDLALTELLIQAQANVNTLAGPTPILTLACMNRDYEMVKLLLDADANANALITQNERWPPLMIAVSRIFTGTRINVDIQIVQMLIEAGADVNYAALPDGLTVLMCTCWQWISWYPLELIDILLDAGADINARESDGVTALMVLVLRASRSRWNTVESYTDAESCIDVAKLLIERGADISLRDSAGRAAVNYLDISTGEPNNDTIATKLRSLLTVCKSL